MTIESHRVRRHHKSTDSTAAPSSSSSFVRERPQELRELGLDATSAVVNEPSPSRPVGSLYYDPLAQAFKLQCPAESKTRPMLTPEQVVDVVESFREAFDPIAVRGEGKPMRLEVVWGEDPMQCALGQSGAHISAIPSIGVQIVIYEYVQRVPSATPDALAFLLAHELGHRWAKGTPRLDDLTGATIDEPAAHAAIDAFASNFALKWLWRNDAADNARAALRLPPPKVLKLLQTKAGTDTKQLHLLIRIYNAGRDFSRMAAFVGGQDSDARNEAQLEGLLAEPNLRRFMPRP